MKTIVKEINKLNIEDSYNLISIASNKAMEHEAGTEGRNTWEEISDLAIKRFVKLFVKASKKNSTKD